MRGTCPNTPPPFSTKRNAYFPVKTAINNLHITATPEGANAENYFMILDVSVTPPAVFSTGKNLDKFIRTPNGWMFKSRTSWSADGERIVIDIGN